MSVPAPHFLLRARATRIDRPGRWSFQLESGDGSHSIKVEDDEPDTYGERLELLALVRGLEAVPQPARVTVVATSPYVNRVLSGGLDEWRASDWQWEHHGEMVPVKNADLWRRVDRALHFHSVDCRSAGSNGPQCCDTKLPSPRYSLNRISSQRTSTLTQPNARTGAPIAATSYVSTEEPSGARACRPKSLSRNALAIGHTFRRRIRQACRRWRTALERLVADSDQLPHQDILDLTRR